MNESGSEATKSDAISEDRLKTLSLLVAEYAYKANQVAATKEVLSAAEKEFYSLRDDIIPSFMSELGMTNIVLTTGEKISIRDIYSADINKEKQTEALAWLDKNGFGDIIKNQFVIAFGKDDTDNAAEFNQLLETIHGVVLENAKVDRAMTVHPQTLKAVVREQTEKGSDIFLSSEAQDLLGIRIFKQAVLK